ncbi:hypothetical protein CCACVL1_05004 [Corchorus capsularis]|uniref:GIR1-like zinc ribbon domain-containing protein n=1 Tax=Corchorus capsularis TaxID=210143 RepID=A0A1R3JND9_COCAP|nr:hypothetical protein CCACVL1_05004 [Corchorus capsularis]
MSRRAKSPNLELELNLSPPRANNLRVESPNTSVSSWAMSPESSCVSSEPEEQYPEETSMVLVGCPRCLMSHARGHMWGCTSEVTCRRCPLEVTYGRTIGSRGELSVGGHVWCAGWLTYGVRLLVVVSGRAPDMKVVERLMVISGRAPGMEVVERRVCMLSVAGLREWSDVQQLCHAQQLPPSREGGYKVTERNVFSSC